MSADGRSWVLLNASPDIRQQIEAFEPLGPSRNAVRSSPIAAIVLTSADVAHCLGLFVLREGSPLVVYSSAAILDSLLRHDALCCTLMRTGDQTQWIAIEPGARVPLRGPGGSPTGLSIEAHPVTGRAPPHLIDRVDPNGAHTLAVIVRTADGRSSLGYAPSVARLSPAVTRIVDECQHVLFDGTFWSDDELSLVGASSQTARDLAHWPLSGPDGSLEILRRRCRGRALLTHINNTNPIVREGIARRLVLDAGIRIADDGMELRT